MAKHFGDNERYGETDNFLAAIELATKPNIYLSDISYNFFETYKAMRQGLLLLILCYPRPYLEISIIVACLLSLKKSGYGKLRQKYKDAIAAEAQSIMELRLNKPQTTSSVFFKKTRLAAGLYLYYGIISREYYNSLLCRIDSHIEEITPRIPGYTDPLKNQVVLWHHLGSSFDRDYMDYVYKKVEKLCGN